MRTTILTEKWIPYQSNRNWLSTVRRSYRSPVQVSPQTSAGTQVRRQVNESAEMLVDARDFVPSDYPYV